MARMTSGASATNSAACLRMRSASPPRPPVVDPHVAADGPAQFLQPLQERREADLKFRIVRGLVHEHSDAPHAVALLRTRDERPRGCRAAESTKKFAPFHCLPTRDRAKCGFQLRPSEQEITSGEMGWNGQCALQKF